MINPPGGLDLTIHSRMTDLRAYQEDYDKLSRDRKEAVFSHESGSLPHGRGSKRAFLDTLLETRLDTMSHSANHVGTARCPGQSFNMTSSSRSNRVRRGAIGVIIRGAKLLLIRRAEQIVRGGCWCFPGGHVEPNETSRQAVVRELREELGVNVTPVARLGSIRLADPAYILAVWQVGYDGEPLHPAPKEVAECRWLTPAEAGAIDPGLASNADVLALLDKRQRPSC